MTDIFISHAVADRHLAEILVDFIVDAIGIPEKSIFCSSVLVTAIPSPMTSTKICGHRYSIPSW